MTKKNNSNAGAGGDEASLIRQQQKEIEELKKQVATLNKTVINLSSEVTMIKSKMEISSHVSSTLQKELDSLQQYSRRNSIVLDNVPADKKESIGELEKKVKDILIKDYKINATKYDMEFDKTHRIGSVNEKNNQPIIIRFKSHSYRSELYTKRKPHQDKPGMKYRLRVSLTKSRRNLLEKAKTMVSENDKINFVYASVNGDIKIRLHDSINNKIIYNIYTESDLNELMVKLDE